VGFGDEIMATGMARGARDRGKRTAFGDGRRIVFGPWSEEIFLGNPNIARPGDERRATDLEWVAHYKGHRLYNALAPDGQRWLWNYGFSATPGELFFTEAEETLAAAYGRGHVFIEPNVPWHKSVAQNKNWGLMNYQRVANHFERQGVRVVQSSHGRLRLTGVGIVRATRFREALLGLRNAAAYVGPEGGLHHAAAALNVPGVVLFGGFIPPDVTGYAIHKNLTGNSTRACGSLRDCRHCRSAMRTIDPEQVIKHVEGILNGG
jgi:hypothetical protein